MSLCSNAAPWIASSVLVLSVVALPGCVFSDLDHQGKTGPCAPGWIGEVGEVCRLPMDAGMDGADVQGDHRELDQSQADSDDADAMDGGADATDSGPLDTGVMDTPRDAGPICSVDEALVLYLNFDGASLEDASGNGNDGIALGAAPTVVPGTSGDGLSFDGRNCIALGDVDAPPEFTMAIWFRESMPGDTGFRSLFVKPFDFGFEFLDNGIQSAIGGEDAWDTRITIDAGFAGDRWLHVAMTYDGSNMNIYYDGVLVSGPTPAALGSNDRGLYIGCWDGVTEYLRGEVDNARLYDRALTMEELRRLVVDGC